MSIKEKLFYCVCLRANKYLYSYGRQANKTLKSIKLPNKIPEWVYETDVKLNTNHNPLIESKIKLEDKKWRLFDYDGENGIFILDKGFNNVAPKKKGKFPFVSATRENNGVSFWCDENALTKTFEGNCLTVVNDGNSMGETFYHPKDMSFGASHSINIIRIKDRELNSYIAMFLIPLIKKEKSNFHYGRKWRIERMRKSKIKLPVNSDNKPDWDFMENFIKSLPYSSNI